VTATTKFDGPSGYVVPSFQEGSLLLKNSHEQFFRLSWDQAGAVRRRPVPVGSYTLVNFRLVKRDAAGREWYLSGIPHHGSTVVVRANEEQRVTVDDSIAISLKLVPTDEGFRMQAPVIGDQHSGLTIYANGARIPMNYKVVDGAGRQLAAGAMTYG